MPGPVLHSPLMDRHFLSHYGTGVERARLQGGGSRIEFARTKELLERYLPPAPARVLDVGGGPGAYAAWLTERGYTVHLIDPVPLHVEQAASLAAECESGFTAALGDARRLEEPDASYDAVLLLGPLYHLVNRDERVRALAEARRVARSGGIVAAAAISRFASLLDGLRSGYLGSPVFDSIVDRDLREGQHRNPSEETEFFTTAYFHRPDELEEEVRDADMEVAGVFGVEGPGWLLWELWEDARGRENILRVARALEREPTLLGVSSHLLAVARRPDG
jgi:ubiquinone/menaquinone biosynthesis C-methylase UbiE